MMKNLLRRIFPLGPKENPAMLPLPGVNFSSVWLGGSKGIQRLEAQNSANLKADKLHLVATAFAELESGSMKSTPIEGIQLALGMPRDFESQLDSFPLDAIRKSPRFFSCYWEQGTKPLWMSALLVGDDTTAPVEAPPADFREFNDAYFLSEIFGIAGSRLPSRARTREKTFATIIRHRPCVVCFTNSGGVGELMEEETWALEVLLAGYDAATYMAAIQLHQAQSVPLPPITHRAVLL